MSTEETNISKAVTRHTAAAKSTPESEMGNAASEASTNKGVLFTLAVFFLYAVIIQFSSDTLGGGSFNLIEFRSELLDYHTTEFSSSATTTPARNLLQFESQGGASDDSSVLRKDDQKGDNPDDPIRPRNKICRDYLKAFLNGTTDSKDECQGLEYAYEHADCSDDINTNPIFAARRMTSSARSTGITAPNLADNSTDKNSTKDDDDSPTPVIDDFFEEFECCKVISHYYSSRCLYHQQFASLSLLGIVAVLILCNLVKSLLSIYGINWLPEAGGCILVGAVVGAVLTVQLPGYQMNLGTFNDDLFLFIMLPPIIFQASLSIHKGKFRLYIFPIIMFAVVGTIIAAVITGFSVHYLTQISAITTTIPLLDSMIFGALISSIDPVAVLSIMHSMGVCDTNMLYILVFGESILNDGVSIAMFESLVMHLYTDHSGSLASTVAGSLNKDLIWSSAVYFWKVSWVSILVGLLTGIACTVFFWSLRGRHGPVAEVASFFCFAMLAYYVSDSVGGSGIVSIMVAGILMDVYVRGSHLTEGDTANDFQRQSEPNTGTYVPVSQNQGPAPVPASGSGSGLSSRQSPPGYYQEEQAGYPLPSTFRLPSYTDCRVMFSGVGHISDRAKIHVGFVADVLANLMETAIFAYLGLFLFSNKKWDDVPLILVGVLSCIVSRVIMIGAISLIVNIAGWFKERMGKMWNVDESNPLPLESQQTRLYIDRNMQLVLLFSGMRGAVSLALAENIPLYDVVTKHGSQFKPALKAMTSSSIIFTVFFFGASTYYTLKRQRDSQYNDELDDVVGNRESLVASLLQTHSLELREDHDRVTPPWMDQDATNGNQGNTDEEPATTFV